MWQTAAGPALAHSNMAEGAPQQRGRGSGGGGDGGDADIAALDAPEDWAPELTEAQWIRRERERFRRTGVVPGARRAAAAAAVRARLVRFYAHHNPAKLANVDTTLAKFRGRTAELFAALKEKYGPDPPSIADAPAADAAGAANSGRTASAGSDAAGGGTGNGDASGEGDSADADDEPAARRTSKRPSNLLVLFLFCLFVYLTVPLLAQMWELRSDDAMAAFLAKRAEEDARAELARWARAKQAHDDRVAAARPAAAADGDDAEDHPSWDSEDTDEESTTDAAPADTPDVVDRAS